VAHATIRHSLDLGRGEVLAPPKHGVLRPAGERREQRRVLYRIQLDLRQRVFQVRQPPLRWYIGAAEALPAVAW